MTKLLPEWMANDLIEEGRDMAEENERLRQENERLKIELASHASIRGGW